jgi:hypothetical protein
VITRWRPDYYWKRRNQGQDIGALRDVINSDVFGDWDVLLWCVDDNVPVRRDFIGAFAEPFIKDKHMGLVGNYWVPRSFYKQPHIPDHFRSSSFAISRQAASRLAFPANIRTKSDCYSFEWRGDNMTRQVRKMGYRMKPLCGDWYKCWTTTSDYIWDMDRLKDGVKDPRCRQDRSAEYAAQFEGEYSDSVVCSVSA